MKILVTGASGFIGRNFVNLLLSEGHEVRALHRRPVLDPELQAMKDLWPARLEFVRRDLSFPDSMPNLTEKDFRDWKALARIEVPRTCPPWPVAVEDIETAKSLLEGCQAVVHIAALAFDWGKDETFFAANVNPLHVLSRAALSFSSPPTLLLVSSMAVMGFGPHVRSTEAGPYFRVSNPYQISKRMAESLLASRASEGLRAGIIRPGNVYGPGDTTTFYPIFEALEQGIMGSLGGGKKLTCPVHVTDLCTAMNRALESILALPAPPSPPPVWNISHSGQVTWKQLLDTCRDHLGLRRNYPDLPSILAWIAAGILEGTYRLLRLESAPPLTFYRIKQLLNDYDFDPVKARKELGWDAGVPFVQGMESSIDAWKKSRKSNETR